MRNLLQVAYFVRISARFLRSALNLVKTEQNSLEATQHTQEAQELAITKLHQN